MLITTMMVVVGHDDGDKQQSTKQCESGVDIDCGCGGGKQWLAAYYSLQFNRFEGNI